MTSSTITTEDFESAHNPSEVLNPIEHRTDAIYLLIFILLLIRLFIIFAEQTTVDKKSASTAITYDISSS
jgi:hypothetical protein